MLLDMKRLRYQLNVAFKYDFLLIIHKLMSVFSEKAQVMDYPLEDNQADGEGQMQLWKV